MVGGSGAAQRVPWVVLLQASRCRVWNKRVLRAVVAGVSTPRVVVDLREMRQSIRAAGCHLLCELVVWLVSLPTRSMGVRRVRTRGR